MTLGTIRIGQYGPNYFTADLRPHDYKTEGNTPQQALLRLAVYWAEKDGHKLSDLLEVK